MWKEMIIMLDYAFKKNYFQVKFKKIKKNSYFCKPK